MFGGDVRPTHRDSDRFRQIADPFSKTSRFWTLFTQWVCTLATTPPQLAAPPPPNGGNCIIRAATRRRYSASQLLMLQNPHRFPCGEQRRGRMARLRCPWAPEGPEGTGELQNAGPGRGAGGRWQGQAGQRVDAQSHTSATQRRRCVGRRKARPRCRWAVAGPGRASRSTTPSRRLACGDLAGGPPPTGTHSGQAQQGKPRGAQNTRGATSHKQHRDTAHTYKNAHPKPGGRI